MKLKALFILFSSLLVFLAALSTYGQLPPQPDREIKLLLQNALSDFYKKNYDAALAKLEEIEKKSPDDPFVLNLMGAVYTKKKDYTSAQRFFEQVLEKKPDFFPAKFNVGELLFLQGQYAEAGEYFEKMQQTDPQNELLQFKVFLCKLQSGDFEGAAKKLKKIKYPGDGPAWYYAQAAWEYKTDNKKKAREYLVGAKYIFGSKTAFFDETFEDLGIKLD